LPPERGTPCKQGRRGNGSVLDSGGKASTQAGLRVVAAGNFGQELFPRRGGKP
jgi:hypothetical protein